LTRRPPIPPLFPYTTLFRSDRVLQYLGVGVCSTEFGKQLGDGLFEFRLRRDLSEIAPSRTTPAGAKSSERILLRVFCHAHGNRLDRKSTRLNSSHLVISYAV